jgi:hypothetical protein
VACEDLGGTYDYDFNDIVFDLGQLTVYTTTTTTSEGQSSSTISLNKAELFLRPLAAGGTLPAYIYFDANGDGIFNAADIVAVSNFLTNVPDKPETDGSEGGNRFKLENWHASDLNHDGRINALDLTLMLRRLLGKY